MCTSGSCLVEENLGTFPVKAVIYSHSHVDHFGGVKGIVSEEEVQAGNVQVIAPEGFEKHAVSENIYAGTAMGRRASYQYGTMLEGGETGSLAIGIGMGQSKGSTSYISPTLEITQTGEKHTIDGVEIEFQLTPGTEAPAEMNFWIGSKNALWMAENCTGTLHNLYTLAEPRCVTETHGQSTSWNLWLSMVIRQMWYSSPITGHIGEMIPFRNI